MLRKRNLGLALFVGIGIAASCNAGAQAQDASPARPGRGALPPANLDAIATAQGELTQVTGLLLSAAPTIPVVKPACSPTMPRFDWRDSKKVSKVQDQQSCGSCWAFAAVGAYESSYLIENNLTKDDANPPDASDQQALDCSFASYSCAGGWYDKVFVYFSTPGEATRPKYNTRPT